MSSLWKVPNALIIFLANTYLIKCIFYLSINSAAQKIEFSWRNPIRTFRIVTVINYTILSYACKAKQVFRVLHSFSLFLFMGRDRLIMPVFSSSTLLALALVTALVSADNSTNCRVPADPDTLGLGVRLGLYFQILSNLALQLIRIEESVDTFLPTAFFFTSFFIAVVYSTAHGQFAPGALIASTWYPLLFFLALLSFDFRSVKEEKKNPRMLLAVLLWHAILMLNVWFWFKGLDNVNVDQCMDPRVFFFANLDARGGVRVLFRILTLGFAIALVTVFIIGMMMKGPTPPVVVYDEERGDNAREKDTVAKLPSPISAPELVPRAQTTTDSKSQDDRIGQKLPSTTIDSAPTTSTSPKDLGTNEPTSLGIEAISPFPSISASKIPTPQATGISTMAVVPPNVPTSQGPVLPSETPKPEEGPDRENWYSALGGLVYLVLYIIATELQMRWNHLDGINSVDTTGQIIPLALGSLSLIRSIYLLKDANWSRLTKEKAVEGIRTLEKKLTMKTAIEEEHSTK
jgi:hypothetical protein